MTTKTSGGDASQAPAAGASVELLEPRHLPSLAAAHTACFPGYFLTNMGPWFLERYYQVYIDLPEAFGVVAVDGDARVLAFAAGTTDLARHDAALVRSRSAAVLWAVTKAAVVNASVRRQVLTRFTRIGKVASRALRRPGRRAAAPAGTSSPRPPSMILTSVGVLPELRGSGLAVTIVEAFEDEVRRQGLHRVRASTGIDNARARAFYEKNGWVVTSIREEANGIDFEHVLDG